MNKLTRHQLGRQGPMVSRIGLGTMGMSPVYGPEDRETSIATVHAALDAGVNLFDTGDFYGSGHNELLLAEALRGSRREEVVLSVKFGAMRDPMHRWTGFDARPEAVKNSLAYSLRRLGVDHLDIYRPARLDPQVPIEETVGAIGEMVDAGYVRHIGLSQVSTTMIRRAAATRPICDLQIEYSLVSRGIEQEILPICRELGIAFTTYGVLSHGLLSRHWSTGSATGPDAGSSFPGFGGDSLSDNLELVAALNQVVEQKSLSSAQLAIAWVLARGVDIVPVIGARHPSRVHDALASAEVELTEDDLAAIEQATIPADVPAEDQQNATPAPLLDSDQRPG